MIGFSGVAVFRWKGGRSHSMETATMSIDFECPYCQSAIKVPDKYAGQEANCPSCQQKINVPSAGPQDLKIVEPGKAGKLLEEIREKKVKGRTCPACGAPLKPGDTRCPRCHVDPNAMEKISRIGVVNESKEDDEDSTSQSMPIGVKIAIVAVLGGAALLIIMNL
jgi:DNA-directed RNA polymerase subunit M/transcription elongation factor TFIIS